MTINVFPQPSSPARAIGAYYSISTGSVATFDFGAGRLDRGTFTFNATLPAGGYESVATSTTGVIAIPSYAASTRGTGDLARGFNSGLVRAPIDATQFQVSTPSIWPGSEVQFAFGTIMFQRFVVGANNTAVLFATFSTVASGYRIYTSTNGDTWTEQTNPGGTFNFGGDIRTNQLGYRYPAAYGNGWFIVACHATNYYLVSTNGFTWTTRSVDVAARQSAHVHFANGFFFAAPSGAADFFVTSTDTVNWTSRPTISQEAMGTAYNPTNGVYVRAGQGPTLFTSTNLTTWTTRNPIVGGSLTAVTFTNGFFAAFCNGSEPVIISTDGITWTTGRTQLGYAPMAITNENMHIAPFFSANVNNMIVIGTSQPGTSSGISNGPFTIATLANIIWTGNRYLAMPLTDARTSSSLRWSSTLTGVVPLTEGYISYKGSNV